MGTRVAFGFPYRVVFGVLIWLIALLRDLQGGNKLAIKIEDISDGHLFSVGDDTRWRPDFRKTGSFGTDAGGMILPVLLTSGPSRCPS